MENKQNLWIVIPAFNEEKVIGQVISDVLKVGFKNIIVVNDGSKDLTEVEAKKSGAIVVTHIINRGKGAATQTGLDTAKKLNAKFVITLDGDGQHSAKDIAPLYNELVQNPLIDVVLGSRFLVKQKIPFKKRLANLIGNYITFIFYGVLVSDSQSGFKGYNQNALRVINTTFDKYEFESEILDIIKRNNLRIKEMPVSVLYTNYSKSRYNSIVGFESQKIFNGLKMIIRMAVKSITT